MQSPSSEVGKSIPPVLQTLAQRVRRLRGEKHWSRAELARRSGVSLRFLARIEAGEGNVSVLRLDAIASALGQPLERLLRSEPEPRHTVALVGLRGAGKSTVGPLLARGLGVPFVEMDTRIQEAAGLPLDQLFELHGARYYRRLERETLQRILSGRQRRVLAAAGGVVNEPATWEQLCRNATVVWLRARPEDHWERVIAQGDRRPMADNPDAMDELRAMLAAREPVYAQAALTVETSGRSAEEVAEHIAGELAATNGS